MFLFSSAKIWLLSKRDQNRIYAQSTKEQKKFLYLPKNVLLHATNFDDLMRAAAVEGRVPQPGKFVDDIFKNLHKIDKWIPELSNLKFLENPKAPPNDGMDVDSKPNRRSDANKSVTPLGSQKRKVNGNKNCFLLLLLIKLNEKQDVNAFQSNFRTVW